MQTQTSLDFHVSGTHMFNTNVKENHSLQQEGTKWHIERVKNFQIILIMAKASNFSVVH